MKKNGKNILWLLTVLSILAGAGGLAQGERLKGLFMLLLGITLCPQAWKVLDKRITVKKIYKIIAPSLFFILTGLTISTDLTTATNSSVPTPADKAGQALVSSTENSRQELHLPQKEGTLAVHFIDVGQGDSILAESGGHYMLIDAGENDQGDKVVTYLQSQGIDALDYVIGTHPHSDHIGGLDDVINNFHIGEIILPAAEHTTKTFEEVLDAIEAQGLKITLPNVGDTYSLGGASFEIIAPNKDYGDDLNNWSVGLKLTYGQNSFVMCGDAEAEAEEDICANGIDITADVLKLGHHGSSTSSCEDFLDRVDPEYAVVSCGLGNSYGHPHEETMEQMAGRGITVFRTDEQGTIVAVSDGAKITWNGKPAGDGTAQTREATVAPAQETTAAQPGETAAASSEETAASSKAEAIKIDTVYVLNTKSKKFHLPSCNSLPTGNRRDTDMSREEIISEGYEPCKRCNP